MPTEAAADAAFARFWVVEPHLADSLDQRLLATLQAWFATEWPLSSIYFCARELNVQQMDLMTAHGLTQGHSVTISARQGRFALFTAD